MQRAETEARVSHIARAVEGSWVPFGDKLAEWQHRFDLLRLMELRARSEERRMVPLQTAAIALRRDMARNLMLYLAMLSATRPVEDIERARSACVRLGRELDAFLARLEAG